MTDEYIARHLRVEPAGTGRSFLIDLERGPIEVLRDDLAVLAARASRFRTIEAHVDHMVELGWEDDGSGLLEEGFRELIDRGLLRSKWAYLEELRGEAARDPADERARRAPDAERTDPITTIAIPTRNRPEALERCVRSWLPVLSAHGRSVRILVVDDSDNSLTPDGFRGSLGADVPRGVELEVQSTPEITAMRSHLVSAGIPEHVVRFCLEGSGAPGGRYGAKRNAVMLATAGERMLSVDDDTTASFAAPSRVGVGLRLFSFFDPTEVTFFRDRDSLLRNATTEERDPLAVHERMLGRSVADLVRTAHDDAVGLRTVTPEFVANTLRYDPYVAATLAGSCGDSGMGSSKMVLNLYGSLRDRLEVVDSYDVARSSRELLRVVDRPTVSEGPFFMGMCFGLDNGRLLPPYFPALRDEDGLWGITLRTAVGPALIGHVPHAVHHLPMAARHNRPEAVREFEPRFAEFLRMLILSLPDAGPRSPSPNALMELGDYLMRLTDLDRREFDRFLRARWIDQMSHSIEYLEELLLTFGSKPEPWAADVQAHIEAVREYAASTRFGAPYDLCEAASIGVEEARALLVTLTRSYGELLTWWPAIMEAAREARLSEYR